MLRSEEVRKLAPEMDPLRMGMGWKWVTCLNHRLWWKVLMETAIQVLRI